MKYDEHEERIATSYRNKTAAIWRRSKGKCVGRRNVWNLKKATNGVSSYENFESAPFLWRQSLLTLDSFCE
ncbi:hypothetical protein QR680_011452 [Steinernema hermaphroditum]|uniref:Uncharacterized protein n=1 Tax=Steinernema hermaphroditum TaxID=289476 RepID=A0AA39HZT1_9BILA|nr:hypothetical protein QR680_011452 [Steinernema hermaphroditum]